MARRLGELDFPDRMSAILPTWASQVVAAIGCTAIAFGLREMTDIFTPAAGPFALTFPSVLLATLFARWQAGVLTEILCALYAWYFVLPETGTFHFSDPTDGPRVAVNVLSGFIIVALAEMFRRAVRRAVAEREGEVEQRDLYLREFDHRVKNNFAIISSILDMQRRQLGDDPAADALAEANSRVSSIARAHRSLYRGNGQPQAVEMGDYLSDLCQSLREGFLDGRPIDLHCHADSIWLERDRAVSIGLLTNELVTNAIKHAFLGRDQGRIEVDFSVEHDALRLLITDDGVGMAGATNSPDRLGQRLITAFVAQAGGTLERADNDPGTRFVVLFDRPGGH